MVNWADATFGGETELPCVDVFESEEVRVKVFEHADGGPDGKPGYLIEIYSFSDLRDEWRLAGRLGDFDLHTVMELLARAASSLYRTRALWQPPRPPEGK